MERYKMNSLQARNGALEPDEEDFDLPELQQTCKRYFRTVNPEDGIQLEVEVDLILSDGFLEAVEIQEIRCLLFGERLHLTIPEREWSAKLIKHCIDTTTELYKSKSKDLHHA